MLLQIGIWRMRRTSTAITAITVVAIITVVTAGAILFLSRKSGQKQNYNRNYSYKQ